MVRGALDDGSGRYCHGLVVRDGDRAGEDEWEVGGVHFAVDIRGHAETIDPFAAGVVSEIGNKGYVVEKAGIGSVIGKGVVGDPGSTGNDMESVRAVVGKGVASDRGGVVVSV